MPKSPSTFPVDSSPLGSPVTRPGESQTPVTRKSPEKWAEILFPNSTKGRLHDDAWKHAAAAQLHGWNAYVERTGKPLELDRATYEAAIAAVTNSDLKPAAEADYRSRS